MVDWFGRWTEEKDYSQYPKEKWCDYDYMAAWIRKQGYESEIENHVSDYDTENGNFDGTYAEAAQAYVMDSGGLSEFDFEV